MTDQQARTLKAFDEEFGRLRARIAEMGGLAEAAVENSMRALVHGDRDLARAVVAADRQIDGMDEVIELDCVRLIALYAPVAEDLREVVASLKISGVIERIGDYAKNIARRVVPGGTSGAPDPLPEMARIAGEMVRDALDAFVARDESLAIRVCQRDDAVDAFYDSIFRMVAVAAESPPGSAPAAHLLHIARSLERIGDHATNIAEMVHFAASGHRLEDRGHAAAARQ